MRNSKAVLLETLLVAALGLALALAANAISSRGLRLDRNYFPGGEKPTAANSGSNPVATGSNAVPVDSLEAIRQRLQKHGLKLAGSNEVAALFRDPRYESGLVVFVDARDDEHYTAGHIPGAWQFHHYRPEKYLPDLLPVCLAAQQLVVYCGGGDCEDSEFAAIMLRDAGAAREKLFVYAGGYNEWTKLGLPVESDARRSGQLRQPKP